MSSKDQFRDENLLYDAHGNPIVDKLGRPIRRDRIARSRRIPRREASAAQPRQESPRTHVPPRSHAPQSQPHPSPSQSRSSQPRSNQLRWEPISHADKQSDAAQSYAPQPSTLQRGTSQRSVRGRQRVVVPTPQPRMHPFKRVLLVLSSLFVVFLLAAGVILVLIDTAFPRVAALPEHQIAATRGTNWLLVGSDSREGLSEDEVARLGTGGDLGSKRTDTIMVLHIPLTGQATLISLPRDSYVEIPGFGMNKINAAFTFGDAPLLVSTVEQATGIHIDHYAEIGMGGLANVVDAVGGIEVCPPEPLEDPLANLFIGAGCQQVDGPTALGYVRTRATPLGDLDRVQRQREFLSALVDAATRPSTLLNPFRAFPMAFAGAKSVIIGEHDHSWHLLRVLFAMRHGLRTETVPIAGFDTYDVGSVVLWDEAASTALFDSIR